MGGSEGEAKKLGVMVGPEGGLMRLLSAMVVERVQGLIVRYYNRNAWRR